MKNVFFREFQRPFRRNNKLSSEFSAEIAFSVHSFVVENTFAARVSCSFTAKVSRFRSDLGGGHKLGLGFVGVFGIRRVLGPTRLWSLDVQTNRCSAKQCIQLWSSRTCSIQHSFAVNTCDLVLGQHFWSCSQRQQIIKHYGGLQDSNPGLSHRQPTPLPFDLASQMFNISLFFGSYFWNFYIFSLKINFLNFKISFSTQNFGY